MQTILAVLVDDVFKPTISLPNDAKLIVFNGTEYIIYEDGDEIPAEFIGE